MQGSNHGRAPPPWPHGWVWLAAILTAVPLLLAGHCRHIASPEQLDRRAAQDLRCPPADQRVIEIDERTRVVEGCGRSATYVDSCAYGTAPAGSRLHLERCTWILNSDIETMPQGGGAGYAEVEPARLAEAAAVADQVAGCRTHATQRMDLELTLDAEGRVTEFRGPIATSDEEACIGAVLAALRVQSVMPLPGRARATFPPPSVASPTQRSEDGSQGGTGSMDATANPDDVPPVDVDTWIRDMLTRQRDAVLACAGTSTLAVSLTLSPPRRLAVALRGDLAGSPEEECIRDVVRSESPPAVRGERTVLRVVR